MIGSREKAIIMPVVIIVAISLLGVMIVQMKPIALAEIHNLKISSDTVSFDIIITKTREEGYHFGGWRIAYENPVDLFGLRIPAMATVASFDINRKVYAGYSIHINVNTSQSKLFVIHDPMFAIKDSTGDLQMAYEIVENKTLELWY